MKLRQEILEVLKDISEQLLSLQLFWRNFVRQILRSEREIPVICEDAKLHDGDSLSDEFNFNKKTFQSELVSIDN